MKTHEFFQKYANVPLGERYHILSFIKFHITLKGVYERIKQLEDNMRPMRIERDKLLEKVEKFL